MALDFGFPRRAYAEFYLKGDWHNLIEDIRQNPGFKIEYGRKSEQSKPTPSECSFQMDDGPDHGNGDYNPRNPMGQWWPDFKRNAPFRFGFELAEDSFDRISSEGWGGDWINGRTVGGTVADSDWSVNGTVAQHTVPIDNAERGSIYQPTDFAIKDVEMRFTFTRPNLDVLGGSYVVVCPFRIVDNSNFLYAYIAVDPTEVITIGVAEMINGTGTALQGGSDLDVSDPAAVQSTEVRVQVEGNTVRVKAWQTGDSEPLSWQMTAVGASYLNAGPVGIISLVNDSNTNADPHVFSYENFSLRIPRFSGEISELEPGMDLSGNNRVISIDCGTIFRRKEKGTEPAQSTLRRYIVNNGPGTIGYWSCEDERFASQISSDIGRSPMLIGGATTTIGISGIGRGTNTVEFEADDSLAASAPLPYTNLSTWNVYLTDFIETGRFDIRFFVKVPSNQTTPVWLIELYTRGTANRWHFQLETDGSFAVRAFDKEGIVLDDTGNAVMYNKPAMWYLQLVQNGANIDYTVTYLEVGSDAAVSYTSGTVVGYTLGRVITLGQISGFGGEFEPTDLVLGHLWIGNQQFPSTGFVQPLKAHIGDSATERLSRLAEENGLVPFGQMDTTVNSAGMGPQTVQTVMKLIIECAETDHGLLFDSRGDNSFSYIPLENLYGRNTTPTLVLDYNQFHLAEGFIPLEDDAGTVNDVTVKALRGSSVQKEQETGSLNTRDPGTIDGAVGRYDDKFDINPETEEQIGDSAGWLLHLGTTEDPRFPSIDIDLATSAIENDLELSLSIMDVGIGDVIAVDNLQEWHIYDRVVQMVIGYTEILQDENTIHNISFNTKPARPYNVGLLSDGAIRLDSDDSTLDSDIDSVTTIFNVSTTDPLTRWVTESDEILSGSAIAQGTALTADYFIATDAAAMGINIGDHCYLYSSLGVLKEATQFTVTGKASAFGFTNIEYSPNSAVVTQSPNVLVAYYASNFPFDIMVGGERMTVTDINLTSDPQEFTVIRQVNNVTKSHSAGSQVQLADPYYLAK